jgi:hypothetical protein
MPHGNKCSGVECVFLLFYGFFVFSFAASLCPQAGEKLFGVTQSRSNLLGLAGHQINASYYIAI